MTDWAEEKAREIVDGCTERRKMTLPSGREADVVVAIHPTADKIAAALREADKRAREECAEIAERGVAPLSELLCRPSAQYHSRSSSDLMDARARRIAHAIRSTIKEASA